MTTGDIDPTRLRIGALEARVAELEAALTATVDTIEKIGANLSWLIEQHGQLVDHVRTLIVMAQDVNP